MSKDQANVFFSLGKKNLTALEVLCYFENYYFLGIVLKTT